MELRGKFLSVTGVTNHENTSRRYLLSALINYKSLKGQIYIVYLMLREQFKPLLQCLAQNYRETFDVLKNNVE